MSKKVSGDYGYQCQIRKTKKRSKRSPDAQQNLCCNDDRSRDSYEASEDEVPPRVAHVPPMEYAAPPIFWQQPHQIPQQAQHHSAHNGQRLFAAMSDPSVCGYSAVPVTYAVEPVSLPPMYRLYQQPMVKPNYRLYRGRPRSSLMRMQGGPPCSGDNLRNGYSSLQENSWDPSAPVAYQNGDYASLPPNANVDNKDNRQELGSEHRRYSDPGLGPADNLPVHSAKHNDDTDSEASSSSITTIGKSNKLLFTFFDQLTKMKETNSQLFKEMHQAKLDLETIKTELQQIKQNVSCDYQPGMLSDVIREIREASNVREEAMLSKMKLLIESQQSEKYLEVDQLKIQLEQVKKEKEEGKERIAKLEKEVSALRLSVQLNSCFSSSDSVGSSESREIAAFEEENLALRRELQEARAARAALIMTTETATAGATMTTNTMMTTTTTMTTTTASTTFTTATTTTTSGSNCDNTSNKMERTDRLTDFLRDKLSRVSCSEDGKWRRTKFIGSIPGANNISISGDNSSSSSSNNNNSDKSTSGSSDNEDEDDEDEENNEVGAKQRESVPRHHRSFLTSSGTFDNGINSMAAPTAGPVTDL